MYLFGEKGQVILHSVKDAASASSWGTNEKKEVKTLWQAVDSIIMFLGKVCF